MPEKSAFAFHQNFYTEPKVVLEDATILYKTWDKSQELKQDWNDTVSQHSNDIGLTDLEAMTIETDADLPPVASKPYPSPFNCHKFVKEEIEDLLIAALIKRLMCTYATPIIVVPRRSKPGVP